MLASTYQQYICSKKWETRRDCYWRTHQKVCRNCGSTSDVQLHHLSYERLGSELDTDLMPLCQMCHSAVHQFHDMRGGSLVIATLAFVAESHRRRITSTPINHRFTPARLRMTEAERKATRVGGREGRLNGLPIVVRRNGKETNVTRYS